MNKLARNTLALGTATMIVTAGLSFSANGADATKSYSAGRFVSGSIGSTNLDTLAQVRGVSAANPGNVGPNKNPLDVTVLSAIPIKVPGGLNLDLAKILSPSGSAGAVTQYAAAPSTSKAVGASGAVSDSGAILTTNGGVPQNAKISLLNGPLQGINANLASVDLGVGALSSNTTVENGSPTRRDYQIAGLNLQVGVPLPKALIGDLTTAVTPAVNASAISLSPADLCAVGSSTLTITSTALLAQLKTLGVPQLLLDTIDGILTPAIGSPITSVNLCDPANPLAGLLNNQQIGDLIKVEITGLDKLTTGLTNFSNGGLAVDLSNGTITLDLAEILKAAKVDINNLPPNTNLLQYLTTGLVSDKITTVIDNAINELVTNVGNVDLKVTVAGTVVPVTLKQITSQVVAPLNQVLTQVSAAVKQIGTPIDAALADLVPNLNQLVKLTANNQSTSKTPTLSTGTVGSASKSSAKSGGISTAAVGDYYRTSALKIDLPSNVLNVDLAASEAATLAADVVVDDQGPSDGTANPPSTDRDSDNQADGTNADVAGDDSDTVADADAQADADVTTSLPSTGAPNLLPFWLLGIGLLLFGGAVLLNEKRRLNQI